MAENKVQKGLKPCPFCGSNDIGLSVKRSRYPFWYTAMYCKKCNCYGARTKVTAEGIEWIAREDIADSKTTEQIAVDAWNERANDGGNR